MKRSEKYRRLSSLRRNRGQSRPWSRRPECPRLFSLRPHRRQSRPWSQSRVPQTGQSAVPLVYSETSADWTVRNTSGLRRDFRRLDSPQYLWSTPRLPQTGQSAVPLVYAETSAGWTVRRTSGLRRDFRRLDSLRYLLRHLAFPVLASPYRLRVFT